MDYRYLITESMREKLNKTNLSPRMLRELQILEESHDKLNADLLHSTKIALERKNRPGGERIIWFEDRRQNGLCLYVLREVYLHDEYSKELKSKEGARIWESNHGYDEFEEFEITNKIEEFLNCDTSIDPLPSEWYPYEDPIRNFANEDVDDVVVYESKEWIDDFFNISNDTILSIVLRDLRDLVSKQNLKDIEIWAKVKQQSNIVTNEFYWLEEGDLKIVFRPESVNGRLSSIFLLSISKSPNYNDLKNKNYHIADFRLLEKRMKRCYPAFFLLDEGLSETEISQLVSRGQKVSKDAKQPLWLQVERDQDGQANLILSQEEKDLLKGAKYPFFINGLAGSGKSTLLYYLFACIYAYQHKHYPKHSLLFLSYSDRLVKKARSFVISILRLNKQFIDTQNAYIVEDMEDFIKPFKTFLRTAFLTEDERTGLFANQNYIDYEKFKIKYQEDCRLDEKKKITPEIVWSVIRVFIKGYKADGFMNYEEYCSMFEKEGATKDLTIDKEMFRLSEIMWKKWYCKYFHNREGWDDLDLVKYILNECRVNRQFATVFCDEAQDFTRVETELIIRLSKHSLYDLTSIENKGEVPIAFAGDPNQTISPTGFRIGSIKKLFTGVFKDLVGIDSYSFEEYPLEINYRSREGIVNFANTIQFIRHKLLDKSSSCNFQYAWDNEGTLKRINKLDGFNYVSFYSLDKHPNLKDYMGKALSILTSEDGEYYVTADENASDDEKISAEETRIRLENIAVPLGDVKQNNVYTAITAKGLEFKSSILYRFASIPDAFDAINAFHKGVVEGQTLNDKESFALSHFMTKLYVSVSRAKEVLFILDTDEAYQKFWKYLSEPDLWIKNVQRDFTITDDKFSLGLLLHDQDEDLIAYSQMLDENFNAKQEAERLFSEAKQEHSAQNMKRARDYYSYDHNEEMMRFCDAYYALFSGNGKDAGYLFLDMGENEEAIGAFWKAMCWSELLNISSIEGMQKLVSLYMSDTYNIKQFMLDWSQYRDTIYQDINNSENIEHEELWTIIIKKVFSDIRSLSIKEVTEAIIESFESFADVVTFCNDKYDILAGMHYKRAQYLNQGRDFDSPYIDLPHFFMAIESWDQNHNTEHNDYYVSKLMVAKNDSERIKWLKLLMRNEEIISRYSSIEQFSSLSEDAAGIVFNCLLAKDYSKAVAYPYPKDKTTKWHRLYAENREQFLIDVVLSDFSTEKYYFLEDKVRLEQSSIFENKLASRVFELIFSLTDSDEKGHPYWTYFTSSLKNEEGERIIKKNIENRILILETISSIIDLSKEYDKSLASCFLDFLFDNEYNVKRTDNFSKTFIRIFSQDVFFKEDFRRVTGRNKYFSVYTDLDAESHDRIKDNIRRYSESYLGGCKRVSNKTSNDVMSVFRALEICAAYQGVSPDFQSICNMYKKYVGNPKFTSIKSWLGTRLAFNQFMADNNEQKASYSKLIKYLNDKEIGIQSLIDDLSKEDASAFIAVVNSIDEAYNYDSVYYTAKLIYKHHIRRDNLKPYCIVKDLIRNLQDSIDVAIDEVLANKNHVDEYAIKVLTFAWEALYEHAFVANHYDNLIGKRRLARVTVLSEYLKKRALLHYSYLKDKLFSDKQEEYGINMTRSYLPSSYPRIEEIIGSKLEPNENASGGQFSGTSKGLSHPAPIIENTSIVDNAKMTAMDIARNMKKSGMTTTQIHQFVPQLTIEEIETL